MQFGRVRDPELVDFSLPALSARSRALLGASDASDATPHDATWLRLGAPAFRHREWAGSLYAVDSDPKQQLQVYATKLGALELNSTFYGLPSETTLARWIEETPPNFRFCPKLPRAISHELRSPQLPQLVAAFVARLQRLGARLGPALVQLPGSVGPDDLAAIEAALATFPEGFALALEVRHADWFSAGLLRDELLELLERRAVASVITDVAGRRDASHASLTRPLAFVRFVGEGGHASDEPRVATWMSRLKEWRAAGLERAYFFVHQPDDIAAPQLLSISAERARSIGIDISPVPLERAAANQLDLFG